MNAFFLITLQVFSAFEDSKISVDVVASSDVSLSITLDNKQAMKGNEEELLNKLRQFADVTVLEERAIISIICNLDRSSEVMARAFMVAHKLGMTVEMLSQGASKVNISFVIPMKFRDALIRALHEEFFGQTEDK
jgi:aspartate kinase